MDSLGWQPSFPAAEVNVERRKPPPLGLLAKPPKWETQTCKLIKLKSNFLYYGMVMGLNLSFIKTQGQKKDSAFFMPLHTGERNPLGTTISASIISNSISESSTKYTTDITIRTLTMHTWTSRWQIYIEINVYKHLASISRRQNISHKVLYNTTSFHFKCLLH